MSANKHAFVALVALAAGTYFVMAYGSTLLVYGILQHMDVWAPNATAFLIGVFAFVVGACYFALAYGNVHNKPGWATFTIGALLLSCAFATDATIIGIASVVALLFAAGLFIGKRIYESPPHTKGRTSMRPQN